MQFESVPIASLKFLPKNARKHSTRNIDVIKESLKACGQQKPIVVDVDGIVLAGNGTLTAAKALGWTDIWVARTSLDKKAADLFAILDNRTAELADWDAAELNECLTDLEMQGWDLQPFGWDAKEREKLKPKISNEGLTDEDAIPENVESRAQLGDVWQMGNHRLICGDSCNILDIEKLMGGQKADMVFTDPPYGVSYQSNGRKQKFDVIANDDTILTEWMSALPVVSSGWVFVWTSWKVLGVWLEATKPIGAMTNMIVWAKGGGGIGDLAGTFSSDYEVALVFNRGAKLLGERLGSVWSVGKDAASKYVHPTQKPVALAEMAFSSCVKSGGRVLDLFLGSGSTLIACEKSNRVCYGMELDPKYCDVIIKRWEQFTGKTASLTDGNSEG